jgi:hypothetical protein
VKAVKAFAEMMPVFRHPRCLNCHGGLDPYSDRHPGSGALDELDLTLLTRELRDSVSRQQCGDCHDNIRREDHPTKKGGWMIPNPPVFFVDGTGEAKSDEELCLQMKWMEPVADSFVSHIERDHGTIQFIEAGFEGDRALGDEGLIEAKLKKEPPPGTQLQLTEKARKWVGLVGKEGYKSSRECGCVKPRIKLKVHHTQVLKVPYGIPSQESSEARFEVTLTPMGDQRPDYHQGQFSQTREIKMTLPAYCKGGARRQERWEFTARVDSASGDITVWHHLLDEAPTGGLQCRTSRGTGGEPNAFPATGATVIGTGEMVIPADSSRKTVRFRDRSMGFEESLTITVVADLSAGS